MSELRIVAGEWRGRRIAVPKGAVRPTADKVRESWMNIVRPDLDGARVADLCAGSGALGLEALSRGASHCDFVEQEATVLASIHANLAALGASERATLHKGSAVRVVDTLMPAGAERPWDVAFADPPYHKGIALALAERWLRAPFAAIFGVEHEVELTLPEPGPGMHLDRRQYGITALSFYRLDR